MLKQQRVELQIYFSVVMTNKVDVQMHSYIVTLFTLLSKVCNATNHEYFLEVLKQSLQSLESHEDKFLVIAYCIFSIHVQYISLCLIGCHQNHISMWWIYYCFVFNANNQGLFSFQDALTKSGICVTGVQASTSVTESASNKRTNSASQSSSQLAKMLNIPVQMNSPASKCL